MTVADLSPHQLFGLIVLAIILAGLGLLALSAYKHLTTARQRFVFWLGMVFVFGVPAYLGLTALEGSFH